MATLSFGKLVTTPALDHPELLAPATLAALQAWAATSPQVSDLVGVGGIDPELSDTAALVDAYGLPFESCVNCVLVAGKRDGVTKVAAVAVRADTRADVNNVVRRLLDVRKASFLPMDVAVAESGMEYGAITPIGVPGDWRVLIDAGVVSRGPAIIGAGIRAAKLTLPGDLLGALPGVEVIDGLARPVTA
ncbi:MAG: hypothetical protein LBR19_06055 [Bifidobacteriaceae bacterium]|jgi:prolyl-tRNA editing enzyme YbaK/EbsC (Cys-tRNA(Pro) deacylase)|nr:hypothetical protein [Bifidobacteriaceae bacterium]